MLYIIYSDRYPEYTFGHTNPFHTERAVKLFDLLKQNGVAFKIAQPEPVTEQDILLAHTPEYLKHLQSLAAKGVGYLSVDTPITPKNLTAAYYAVGGTILAARLALQGHIPVNLLGGLHHAQSDNSSGFCLFNDHAIAIRKLQQNRSTQNATESTLIKTAAVLDLDVHPGNGTQEIFFNDPSVLTVSIHERQQSSSESKIAKRQNTDLSQGYTINRPLPPGTGEAKYLEVLREVLNEVESFKPDILFVVLGVDTFKEDPLARFELEEESYGKIAQSLRRYPKKVILLAGGYSDKVPELWFNFISHLEKSTEYPSQV